MDSQSSKTTGYELKIQTSETLINIAAIRLMLNHRAQP
jgi:hypothetical protein